MGYPEKITATLLEQRHPEYGYYQPTWEVLQDIQQGASTITRKLDSYLPKRPGEDLDVYELRKAKACWTPIMATAIREFTAKLVSAPLHIEGVESDFWAKWRESVDGDNKSEKELLNEIFSCLLYYGSVFVAVDKPALEVYPRSAYEAAALTADPYIVVYAPLSVINWGDDWYLTRQINVVCEPLQKPKHIITWTIWDNQQVTVYQAEAELAPDGSLLNIKVGNAFVSWDNPAALVSVQRVAVHGLGKPTLIELILPEELWAGNNVYQKQLQHFRIESSWTDAGTMAGTIQRVFTPTPPVVSDPRYTYEEPEIAENQFDNAHVLIGNKFEFVESSGTAIANLTNQLEVIERQIRQLVSMGQASVSTSVLEQSGKSKEIDREPLEDTMKAYGTKVARFYQEILELVSATSNQNTEINVAGLDSYGTEDLKSMLDQTAVMLAFETSIPETALRIWYGKISNLLTGSRSSETDKQIQAELEKLTFGDVGLEDTPENVEKVARTFGMTPAEAKKVISGKESTSTGR